VAIEGVVLEAHVLGGGASGPEVLIAPEITDDGALPESSIVVRSPEIQDAEPIRLAPMSETATTSQGGLELLADDLINPAMVARNLESMRRAELGMKVHGSTFE
jgi:hypothetical protein